MKPFEATEQPDSAPYLPVQLANTFIERYGQTADIDHMKLQKLMYYAYGWWLALRDTPLISAKPQVWKLGPVFRPVYSAFASHRGEPIKDLKKVDPFSPPYTIPVESEGAKVVDWIWDRYGHYTGIELSEKTHEVGTPWHNKVKELNFVVPKFLELDDAEIRPYFYDLGVKEGFIDRRELAH
ncbi:MAG: Panacea domain-containing protein [Paracoccus sp. (in: a-proteobacteria)]|uniref:Panacea domain-containing protein n=1 Tax=Paracoccus sp. TaxID=267 RepID=UPI0040582015